MAEDLVRAGVLLTKQGSMMQAQSGVTKTKSVRKRKIEPAGWDSSEDDSGDERLEATENIEEESYKECRPIEFGGKSCQTVRAVDRQIGIWKEWTRTGEGHCKDRWLMVWNSWRLVKLHRSGTIG